MVQAINRRQHYVISVVKHLQASLFFGTSFFTCFIFHLHKSFIIIKMYLANSIFLSIFLIYKKKRFSTVTVFYFILHYYHYSWLETRTLILRQKSFNYLPNLPFNWQMHMIINNQFVFVLFFFFVCVLKMAHKDNKKEEERNDNSNIYIYTIINSDVHFSPSFSSNLFSILLSLSSLFIPFLLYSIFILFCLKKMEICYEKKGSLLFPFHFVGSIVTELIRTAAFSFWCMQRAMKNSWYMVSH